MKRNFTLLLLAFSLLLKAQVPEWVQALNKEADQFYTDTLQLENSFNGTEKLNEYYQTRTDYYRYYAAERQIIKGVRIHTDNDLFAMYDNRDHEYTGGLRVELITDYLRVKLLSFRPDYKFLSYQSFFFGFEGYTPDQLNVFDPQLLNPNDRPFASFQYFGRSRNIMAREGHFRISSELRVGLIGGDFGRNFQRIIHRDITDSENNNGWDFQIANGGRLALQYDLVYDWQYQFEKRSSGAKRNLYLNYGFIANIGSVKLAATPVLTITNKSFFDKNPHYSIHVGEHFGNRSLWNQIRSTLFYEASIRPELVLYNAMLQGYFLDNNDFVFDPESQVNVEVPVIEDINNIVGRYSFGFGFRAYNSTFLFDYVILSPEYDYSFKEKAFHNYARLSLTMNLWKRGSLNIGLWNAWIASKV